MLPCLKSSTHANYALNPRWWNFTRLWFVSLYECFAFFAFFLYGTHSRPNFPWGTGDDGRRLRSVLLSSHTPLIRSFLRRGSLSVVFSCFEDASDSSSRSARRREFGGRPTNQRQSGGSQSVRQDHEGRTNSSAALLSLLSCCCYVRVYTVHMVPLAYLPVVATAFYDLKRTVVA